MNYYYKQVTILVKKHLTVDCRLVCNDGVKRCVFIFIYSIKINIPAVSRGSGALTCACAKGTKMS